MNTIKYGTKYMIRRQNQAILHDEHRDVFISSYATSNRLTRNKKT